MRLPTNILSRIAALAVLIPLAACSTTGEPSMVPTLPTFAPIRPPVNSTLAEPCISAAASKYFLSESNIKAVDVEAVGGGVNQVRLKADLRDAMCTVTDKGKVRSVVDTMPKSADQAAAEEAAAQKAANPAAAPAPVKKSKKKS
ncbi:hypothetical protein [Phyllobacterium zundukense]|uniref:Uncharacterized protein n=1 Tax=Phyllobacterium zundukense TaxID=1867719 RepID=A0A2N9VVV3_9HYPH|nr:hypothetical protein [Phyllobacterium zundukense]ATU91357.1 hypothetical protein BLM14_06685 [Phyllobacterium zundukense]PIO43621.1 hypothetical protein B5P45_17070 [Phyllobacterium zundukense]